MASQLVPKRRPKPSHVKNAIEFATEPPSRIELRRKPKSTLLKSISPKFVPDSDLEDCPARLFRRILNKLEMNPFKWNSFLSRYLDWVVTNPDEDKARLERQTRIGNIKETYFHKPTLTFNKLLEGLSILEIEECTIDLTVKDIHGNIIRVSDVIHMVTKSRKELIIKALEAEDEDKAE